MTRPRKKGTDKTIFEMQSRICKAFANPTRLHILHLLGKHDWAASDLRKELGISMTNLSQHVALLRASGVVTTSRRGRSVYCSLAMPEVKRACQLIHDVLRQQIRASRGLVG